MKVTAVIMAGGVGERFWPKSRASLPKQFLSLTGDGKTLIQATVDRIQSVVKMQDIFIVTNERYYNLVLTQLVGVLPENIILETVGRNTAPCIAVAAGIIEKKYNNAAMIVLPSDHIITNENEFLRLINLGIKNLTSNNTLTIGIKPEYPETGYGYIKYTKSQDEVQIVERFVEKPDLQKAKQYLLDGNYLWNSGIFLFYSKSILKNISDFMPELYRGAMRIKDAYGTSSFHSILADEFNNFSSVSIDYGVMEKADNIHIIPGDFGWDDCGSWLALDRINPVDNNANYLQGDVMQLDTFNSIIISDSKFVTAIGLKDIIIVDTADSLLVCSKDKSQDIKKVIQYLKNKNRSELL